MSTNRPEALTEFPRLLKMFQPHAGGQLPLHGVGEVPEGPHVQQLLVHQLNVLLRPLRGLLAQDGQDEDLGPQLGDGVEALVQDGGERAAGATGAGGDGGGGAGSPVSQPRPHLSLSHEHVGRRPQEVGGDAAQDFEGIGRYGIGAWTRLSVHELVEQLGIITEWMLLVNCKEERPETHFKKDCKVTI